jgi:hypothetical protein
MTTTTPLGVPTGGKPINLAQLQAELEIAGVDVSGLGMADDLVYTYDVDGLPADFTADKQPVVQQTIADHVAMRDKTDAEYSAEFQNPATTPARKQEIRDITAGLLPREQVSMT